MAPFEEVKAGRANAEILIYPEYSEALEGIEGFSHLLVIYWLHRFTPNPQDGWRARPRGREDMPLLGVLATRVARRPNPIGLSVVELVARRGTKLEVRGLDAFDGTPVVDIKPYDFWDVKTNIRVPDWWLRMEKSRRSRRRDLV